MKIGILGFPKVGKTTLFNLLTGLEINTDKFSEDKKIHTGAVSMEPRRMQELADLIQPKKMTYPQVEYIDMAGLKKDEMKSGMDLKEFRNVEAIAHVVRKFEDEELVHSEGLPDPLRDIQLVEMELLLADMAICEKRVEKIRSLVRKTADPKQKRELEVLERCQKHLEGERPLRELSLDDAEKFAIRGYAFLTLKPLIHVINVGETGIEGGDALLDRLRQELNPGPGTGLAWLSVQIEEEITRLPDEDSREFMDDLGLKESGRTRFLRTCMDVLETMTFFTAGEEEVRAWFVHCGATAQEAAGKVHSDFARAFIRAEVIHVETLLECGSMGEARKKGLLRLEGKQYPVQEGDVIYFRAGV